MINLFYKPFGGLSSLLDSFVFYILFIILFVFIPLFNYFITKKFYLKLNFRSIFFLPILFVFLILNLILIKIKGQKYFVIKKSPQKKIFDGFNILKINYAESDNYKFFKIKGLTKK